jgi:hypothetical protein
MSLCPCGAADSGGICSLLRYEPYWAFPAELRRALISVYCNGDLGKRKNSDGRGNTYFSWDKGARRKILLLSRALAEYLSKMTVVDITSVCTIIKHP